MTENRYYRAFGLTIESCFPISQVPETAPCVPDVRVVRADLSEEHPDRKKLLLENGNLVYTTSDTVFRVTNGDLIEADVVPGEPETHLGVYLMGSCMGSILIQRGFMLLHGSCVTDGKRAVLISGNSGAGKSTLAAEFLKQGWKLVTDDVTCVYEQDGVFMVRPSYPSQKLWQDAMDRYKKVDSDVHSLYFDEDREKFGVDVSASFYEGNCPLSIVVRLLPADQEAYFAPIEGMTKVDQLMRNTYRIGFIPEKDRQRHFQRCVTLSTKVPMALAVRENGKDCAPMMFEKITKFLEEHYHD